MSAPPPIQPTPDPGQDRVVALAAYFEQHRGAFTPEALRSAAEATGYTPAEIEAALDRTAGQASRQAIGQVRSRARFIVLGTYGLVYVILAMALLSAPNLDIYAAGEFALIVLTVVLGVALLISIWWVNSRGRPTAGLEGALMAMLVGPLILLVAIAGLCVATTRPFGAPV
jgi:hypothetical protein